MFFNLLFFPHLIFFVRYKIFMSAYGSALYIMTKAVEAK